MEILVNLVEWPVLYCFHMLSGHTHLHFCLLGTISRFVFSPSSSSVKFMSSNTALFSITDMPGGSNGKESACNAGDPGSITGSGRSPGDGDGSPLQNFYLENPMDRGAWWAIVYGLSQRVGQNWATKQQQPVSSTDFTLHLLPLLSTNSWICLGLHSHGFLRCLWLPALSTQLTVWLPGSTPFSGHQRYQCTFLFP